MSRPKYRKVELSDDLNFLNDRNLSASARGVLATMLFMPEDWKVSIDNLTQLLPDGKTSISTALNNLEKHGYIQRVRVKTTDGRFDWCCNFSYEPIFLEDQPD